MALVLSGERPDAAAVSNNPVRVVVAWFAKLRSEIAQRQALQNLLDLDRHRLEDLGISRSDLFDAMAAQQRPTRLLVERRRARGYDVLNP
jgi:uncharacterized protein YjiS (DUF1127 family)